MQFRRGTAAVSEKAFDSFSHCRLKTAGRRSEHHLTRKPEYGPSGFTCDVSALSILESMLLRTVSARMPFRLVEIQAWIARHALSFINA